MFSNLEKPEDKEMAHRHWMKRERNATKQQHRFKIKQSRKTRNRTTKVEGSAVQISNRNWLFVRREKKQQNRAARRIA